MTPAGEMRAALHAGRRAAETGQPPANPYSGTAGDARERMLARMWRIGYRAGNPVRLED
ncbi:ribosome modulation factor [Saccharothrix lopnurensis]|uniref:Uncharacterized protein n=1 Tax=Saccharothrix lopnurensis TaxID=1670621 RepID=A0ABW1P5L3_9PSEU